MSDNTATQTVAPLTARPNVRTSFVRRMGADPFRWFAPTLVVLFGGLLLFTLGGMGVRLLTGEDAATAVERAFATRGLGSAIQASAILLVTAVPIALVIAGLFAWLNERTDAAMGWVSSVLPLLPFLLPPVALSIGWVFLGSQDAGFINAVISSIGDLFGIEDLRPFDIGTWPGLVFVYVLHIVPLGYLTISAALRNVDSAQDEASRISGGGPLRTALRVSLPLVLPAIAAGALLMTVSTLALFSVPTVIGSEARITPLSVHIVRLVKNTYPPALDEAVVLSSLVFVVIFSTWWLQRWISQRGHHATIGGKRGRHSVVALGPWKWVARAVMILYLLMTSLLPLAALTIVALQPFWTPNIRWDVLSLNNIAALFQGSSQTGAALANSAGLGLTGATVGILIAAVLVVYARERGGSTARLIDGGTKIPAAISHIVLGVAFIVTLGVAPFNLQGTTAILLIAYIVVYMPQASISAGSANAQIGTELLEASRMSGATPGRTFSRVTLPLMIPGLAAGWALLLVLIVGDLTISALLAGNTNPVVGFEILSIYEHGTFSSLAAMALLVTLMTGTIVTIVLMLSRWSSSKSSK